MLTFSKLTAGTRLRNQKVVDAIDERILRGKSVRVCTRDFAKSLADSYTFEDVVGDKKNLEFGVVRIAGYECPAFRRSGVQRWRTIDVGTRYTA